MRTKILYMCLLLSQCACSQNYTIRFIDQYDIILLSITQKLDKSNPCFVFDEKEMRSIAELDLHKGYIDIVKGHSVIQRFQILGIYDSDIYDYSIPFFLSDGKGSIKLENNIICINKNKNNTTGIYNN